MKHSRKAIALGVITAGLIAFASVGTVAAVTPSTQPARSDVCAAEIAAARGAGSVSALRAVGDCQIARRFTTLDTLSAAIAKATALTSSDAATLNAEIASTRSGLTTLKAKIDAETSLDALKAEVKQIATDYRVYLVVAPKTHLVIAADRIVASDAVFGRIGDRLEDAIAKAKAAGKDVTAAQAALDDMKAKVTQAIDLARPLPVQLLPLTPAQYNAGAAGPIINAARATLVHARDLLKQARQDAVTVRNDLKALK